MRTIVVTGLILIQICLSIACAATRYRSTWPEKGFPVYISRDLYPDPGQPRGVDSTVDFLTGRSERNPAQSRLTPEPSPPTLPACEPAEVRAVHKTWLRVRWLRESQYSSTLNGDWGSVIHRSREECLERMKTLTSTP